MTDDRALAEIVVEGRAMTAPAKPDPLSVWCDYCRALPGKRCRILAPQATVGRAKYGPKDFHAARVRAAEREEKEKGK